MLPYWHYIVRPLIVSCSCRPSHQWLAVDVVGAGITAPDSGEIHKGKYGGVDRAALSDSASTGTLHILNPKSTPGASISFIFNGTAVYIYGVLTSTVSAMMFLCDYIVLTARQMTTVLDFELDALPESRFSSSASGDVSFSYKECVFSKAAMTNQEHTLTILPSGSNPLMLFDHVIYT